MNASNIRNRDLMNGRLTQHRITGYHVPAVRHRDRFYAKLEDERMKGIGQDPEIQSGGM